MRNYFTLIFIVMFTCISYSQWFWQNPLPQGNTLNSTYFVDVNIGCAVGNGGTILKTTDGGGNWILKTSGTTKNLNSVFLISSAIGYAVGDSGIIIKTTNAGESWTEQNSGTSLQLNSVFFTTLTNGWACGDYNSSQNTFIRTTDGGYSWEPQFFGGFVNYKSVFFYDPNLGWAVGNGACATTTNSGDSWEAIGSSSSDLSHNAVFFASQTTGWIAGYRNIAGNYGYVNKSIDGGSSWVNVLKLNSIDLNSLYFTSLLTGFVVGQNGIILKTADGGNTWGIQSSSTSQNLHSVYFLSSSTGWAVGDGGTIIKTTNGGVTFIDGNSNIDMPKRFILSQNYPNPFNPTTRIKYEVPKSSFVTIKIFNILGKEVASLVNENKKAGDYNVEFNASKLSSGVYFYQMTSSNFSSSKKMILLK